MVLRRKSPKGTILCFNTGKIIMIGGQSEYDAEITAMKSFMLIQKLLNRNDLILREFKITNVVANAAVGFPINLNQLCESDRLATQNAKFPGVVYKGIHRVVKSVLIFASGKMVLTGARSLDALE